MSNSMAYRNNPWDDLDTLCDYIEGRLSEEDRKVIASEITRSDTLASKVEGIKYFYNGKFVDREAMQEFMDRSRHQQVNLIQTHFAKKKSTKKYPPFLKIAAALLFLFTISLAFFFFKPSPFSPEMYAEQILSIPYTFPPSQVRGKDSPASSNWLIAYQEDGYDDVISQLNEITQLTEQQSFVLGLSHLYLAHHSKAQIQFQQIIEQENLNSLYVDQARWYLIISHLATNEVSKALSIIEPIIEKEKTHYRYQEIEEIFRNTGNR